LEPFRGTTRYEVLRALGQGANGVVYEAIDREQGGRRVALKTLQRRDAEALMRIKREFRALADVRHPNLVSLYDLVAEGDTWFYTLELIEGVDFLSWLRPVERKATDTPTARLDRTVPSRERAARDALDLARLRAGFRQLGEGVAHLHAEGRHHRDLKPSNVLVTQDGRVVVLDFGLVAGAGVTESITEAEGRQIVGTVGYMSPEQADSGKVGAASDWYAVGVMLFEALTGRLPFEGTLTQVLLDKKLRPAPAPRELNASVPEDLDALCVRLLQRAESERAGAPEVLAAFGAQVRAAPVKLDSGFVGRERELQALRDALAGVRGRGPGLVRVLGGSGIGKSALIRRFVEEAEVQGAVVLAGRCYEREAVPFKALDSVVDALARYLAALEPSRVDAVLPRDAHALARMFPVMGRVPAFLSAPSRDVPEAAELRRRAVRALRELISRMADRSPLVLVIDDAQWGDADSAAVLDELLRQPDAPEVLVIVGARGEVTPLQGLSLAPVDLPLSPLGPEESALLARRAVSDDARAVAIAKESGGNPFLLQQLIDVPAERDVRLEDVVRSRLDALPAPARRLLEVVAIAAAPVPEAVAVEVAGLTAADADVVQQLKSERLVRSTGEGRRLETWHDRIREAVARGVDPERARDVHARLAVGLRALPDAELDEVAWHFTVAGLVEQAAQATLEAAKKAVAQLAFERAAVLYRRALELMPEGDQRRREVTVALGDALSDAGRGQSAAQAYALALEQHAAIAPRADDRLELQRRAAEQLLRSGHIDEGLTASREVLRQVGLSLAKTPRRALFMLAWRRLVLKLRGLGYRERSASEVPVDALQRIDVCWSISMGLAMVDTIRGAAFQSKQLILALEAGEPYRVARALSAEAAFLATGGLKDEARARRLVAEATAVAKRVGDPQLLGLIEFCDGLTHFLVGRWREAAELTARAERTFTDQGYAVTWEAANSRLFAVWSHFYLGDISGLSRRIPVLVREAERRGDRYAVTSLQSGLANVSLLATDAPEEARAAVRRVMAEWGSRQFHFQHYWALLSEGMIDLYVARPQDSVERVEAGWGQLKSAMLLQIQNVRVEARYLRARLAVALGRAGEALSHAEAIEEEGVEWGNAFALATRGVVAGKAGEAQLKAAVERFSALDMQAFAAAARLRLGEVQGGEIGAANVRAGLGWLTAQGVRNPEAFAAMLLPRPPR
jgi:tRNA A-37 threonylcarbamoyl transferase component Bud32/tetratricopeptide (TPR) repeat protein